MVLGCGADSKKQLHGGGSVHHPFASPASLMSLAAEFHKSVIGPPAFPYPPAHLAAAAAAAAASPFAAAFMPLAAAHPGMMNLAIPGNHLQPGHHVTSHAAPDVTSSRDRAA